MIASLCMCRHLPVQHAEERGLNVINYVGSRGQVFSVCELREASCPV